VVKSNDDVSGDRFGNAVERSIFADSVPAISCSRYNPKTDKVGMSRSRFKYSDLNILGALIIKIFRIFKIIDVRESVGEDGEYMECNNLTLNNFLLKLFGSMHERRLCILMLLIQVRLHGLL
jgi:UDP-N-acetylglucosamine--dolichyl-phosphate N-acetylglucosaminephosphotransferase